jgi:hypothetical protein
MSHSISEELSCEFAFVSSYQRHSRHDRQVDNAVLSMLDTPSRSESLDWPPFLTSGGIALAAIASSRRLRIACRGRDFQEECVGHQPERGLIDSLASGGSTSSLI